MNKTISYIYVILSAVCWGFIGFSNRLLTEAGMTLGNRVFVRNFGTLLVLTVVFALFHRQVFRIRLKHLPIFLGSGLISILLLSVVYFQCQTMCSLSVAAVLLYLAPSFVVLASAVLWKTPLTKGKIAALCVSLLGCVMVSGIFGGDMTASWAGIGLGVVSGMCYASYTVFSHYGLAHYESYTMIYWTFLVAGLGSVFFADIPALLPVFRQPQGIIGGICVVVVATVLPYIFYTKGLEGVESGRASIITNIEPVVETLVGITVFHEALTVWTVLGVGFLLGQVCNTDYGGWGVLLVTLFYLTREVRNRWAIQLVGLALFCWFCSAWRLEMLAMLSLIPLCLYNGERGFSNKALQYGFYAFYPVHILILSVLARYVF